MKRPPLGAANTLGYQVVSSPEDKDLFEGSSIPSEKQDTSF
jgi:hypothetical protein